MHLDNPSESTGRRAPILCVLGNFSDNLRRDRITRLPARVSYHEQTRNFAVCADPERSSPTQFWN